jgi:hypothetical protein
MTSLDRFRNLVSAPPVIGRPSVLPLPPATFARRPILDPPYANAGR